MAKTFTIYTGNDCRFCKLAKLFITNNGGEVIEKNVDTSVTAFEEHAKTGAMGVPVIQHEGKTWIGFGPAQQEEIADILWGQR